MDVNKVWRFEVKIGIMFVFLEKKKVMNILYVYFGSKYLKDDIYLESQFDELKRLEVQQ